MGFDAYFERDYFSAQDFVEQFGVDEEHPFTIAMFDMRESWDADEKKKVPKPVVFLLELDKPMFLNRTNHEALRARFGPGYEDKERTIGQVVSIRAYLKNAGRDKPPMPIVEILRKPHPDMHAPIGEQVGKRWLERLAVFGGSPTQFLDWLVPRGPKLADLLARCPSIAAYPRLALKRMGEYVDEREKDIVRKENPRPPANKHSAPGYKDVQNDPTRF